MPTGGRLTSWLFTKHGGVEFGATEDKSIQCQGGGFETGTSRLPVQHPTTRPHSPKFMHSILLPLAPTTHHDPEQLLPSVTF